MRLLWRRTTGHVRDGVSPPRSGAVTQEIIPFNRPTCTGDEGEYIARALANGTIAGDGPFSRRCAELLERELGVTRALLTPSCTHALEMAALLLGFRPGDEVVVPSFTFVSTANAFVLHGATPVFADVRPDTFNLDERSLDALFGPRTRAVVAMHYAGVGCEMDAILAAAARRGVAVVEDNAHGLFGRYRDRCLGSFGVLAAQSFHETKNFTCGEGGALLVNDGRYVERALVLRHKGTDRSRFLRGEVDRYTWVDVGSNYQASDLQAAFLFAQFECRTRIQAERERVWKRYAGELADWAGRSGVVLPRVPPHCQQPFHMFQLLLPSAGDRDRLLTHLLARGIGAVFHYVPLHLSAMGRRFGGREGQCPVSEDVSGRLVRLPFFNALRADQQDRVIEAVVDFRPG